MNNEEKKSDFEKMSFRLSCLQMAGTIKKEPDEIIDTAGKYMKFIEEGENENTNSV